MIDAHNPAAGDLARERDHTRARRADDLSLGARQINAAVPGQPRPVRRVEGADHGRHRAHWPDPWVGSPGWYRGHRGGEGSERDERCQARDSHARNSRGRPRARLWPSQDLWTARVGCG
jgi:hypothetical protein